MTNSTMNPIYVSKTQSLLVNERGRVSRTILAGERLPDGVLPPEKIERLLAAGVLTQDPTEPPKTEDLPVLPVESLPGEIKSTTTSGAITQQLKELRAEQAAKKLAEAQKTTEVVEEEVDDADLQALLGEDEE